MAQVDSTTLLGDLVTIVETQAQALYQEYLSKINQARVSGERQVYLERQNREERISIQHKAALGPEMVVTILVRERVQQLLINDGYDLTTNGSVETNVWTLTDPVIPKGFRKSLSILVTW